MQRILGIFFTIHWSVKKSSKSVAEEGEPECVVIFDSKNDNKTIIMKIVFRTRNSVV